MLLISPWVAASGSGSVSQTDWSGGPRVEAAADRWSDTFQAAEGISWLSIPGQLSLSSEPLPVAEEHLIDGAFVRPAGLAVADLDRDGDVDVVGAAIGGNSVAWWENVSGDGSVWVRHPIDDSFPGAITVRVADLDGDADLDVAGGAWNGNEVAWWRNDGDASSWTGFTIATGADGTHWVDLADLDDDGDVDIVAAIAGLDTVSWWRNGGGDPVTWERWTIDSSFDGARSAVPFDLDRDGRIDVVGAALDGNEVSWWKNLGGEPSTWTKQVVSAGFSMAHHVVPADLDRDGDHDLVGAGYQLTRLGLWRNQGGDPPTWDREVAGGIAGPLVLDVRDLDGDGRVDVVATSDLEDAVMWWRNDGGDPLLWPELAVTDSLPGAWPLAVADLDGNGSLDVVAGASESTDVAWWRLGSFVPAGVLTGAPIAIDSDVLTLDCELDAVTPAGTSVMVEFRTASRVDALGGWKQIACGHPVPVIRPRPVVVQYRLLLRTEASEISPIVQAIRFDWSSELTPQPPRRPSGRLSP
jgi:hypothetical protein